MVVIPAFCAAFLIHYSLLFVLYYSGRIVLQYLSMCLADWGWYAKNMFIVKNETYANNVHCMYQYV